MKQFILFYRYIPEFDEKTMKFTGKNKFTEEIGSGCYHVLDGRLSFTKCYEIAKDLLQKKTKFVQGCKICKGDYFANYREISEMITL